jgi:hypothetical protein
VHRQDDHDGLDRPRLGRAAMNEAKSSIGRMQEKTARQEKRVQKSGLRGGFQKAQ